VGRYRRFVDAVVGGDAAPPWTPAPGSGKHVTLNDGGGLVNGGGGPAVYETGWDPSWNAYLPTTKAAWDAGLLSCRSEAGPSSATWTPAQTSAQDGIERFPIDCVNWYQAYAFCIWDGGFLPSAAEWYRAAAPPDPQTGQRIYAWGDNPPQPDCRLAVWGDYYAGGSFSGNGVFSGVINIAPVGTASKGRGLWGQLDLTGNILEWTLDYWTGSLPNPCVDCANTAAGTQRIMRGGAFDFDYRGPVDTLANTYSVISPPAAAHGDVGFRCARAP
jgi:formylglycine-generating enzyme required for sulfatase activity